MSTDRSIRDCIDRAATDVGSVWPLHSFVTANPLSGLEDRPFVDAVRHAGSVYGARGYPRAETFRRAWEAGQIDPDLLAAELADAGFDDDPEALLSRMESAESAAAPEGAAGPQARVDALLTKWLAAFLDQGRAEWAMPHREEGFYAAVRRLAPHDRSLPDRAAAADLPERPLDAIRRALDRCPPGDWESIFAYHLTALPGWTGLIKQRADADGEWQSAAPVTLVDYLAVRLTLARLLDAPVEPPAEADDDATRDESLALAEAWLSAWEATYRESVVDAVADAGESSSDEDGDDRPDAQLVFCIDTRSEVFRRHLEATGDYETHGYAGFFGVPMRFEGYGSDVAVDACPPILSPQHRIADRPSGEDDDHRAHDRWTAVRNAAGHLVESLQSNAATAFSFVESTGAGYGVAVALRTLTPGVTFDLLRAVDERVPDAHEFCEPTVDGDHASHGDLPAGLTTAEKVEYARAAFETMGWETFGRVVAFVGHASQTANNPYGSSLDCGACAGNPGGPSARVLAAVCNDDEVKDALRDRGFDLPEDTVFVAGEHNTTTDEVTLYAGDVPESHRADVERLRADLDTARSGAAAERAATLGGDADSGVRETERRAADWAEVRPEWGLAGNAAFVVGPPDLTGDIDFGGRSFLHSYDPTTDPDGDALEAILTGPMVVTQWINTQYYFATVDNAVFGSGSKITQNPVGNVGVFQGNGGDLMAGLPLQSVMAADDDPYHQPLRLSTVVYAPVDRVTPILSRHPHLAELLDNGWLSLTVVDPTRDHAAFEYDGDLNWTRVREGTVDAPDAPRASPRAMPTD